SSQLSSENWSSPFAASGGRRDDRHAVVAARADSFDQRSSSGAWLVACDPAEGSFGVLVRLLILTGQRRDGVGGMRRSEIKADLWTLPANRTKNGKQHDVPLSCAVLDILAGLPRIGEDFVLTVAGTESVRGFARGKRRLDALLPSNMPPWVLHD